ncbi:hypothetical protein SAMN05421829_102336 [Aromatoleum tolulyticum]|uniref:Uncharacterized protein n=2 Tax=Aromatoleum tolulyticum TaxID=34027 RepID=A0A1N6Q466_9RHOO|nr:hypothetical protein SAMN05421829_102336 [Aromatoleum tolulyticum]
MRNIWVTDDGELLLDAGAARYAALVESELIAPARELISGQGDGERTAAVLKFVECAEEVLYAVRYDRTLTGYHVDDLCAAWGRMLEQFAGMGGAVATGQKKGGSSRKGKLSPLNHAIERICEKLGTRDYAQVLDEIRLDTTEGSDLLDDLRAARENPVRVRFQEIEGDCVRYLDTVTQTEQSRSLKTLKNQLAPKK